MTIGLDPFRALRRHRQQWIHSAAHLTYRAQIATIHADSHGHRPQKILTCANVQEHRYYDQDNSRSWKREASPWCGLDDATAASMQPPQAGAYYLPIYLTLPARLANSFRPETIAPSPVRPPTSLVGDRRG